jgi:PAT family beta-lactamase induction signal transducer AmpG
VKSPEAAPWHPPPWLFVLTGMPYGIVGGFVATTMPYFTRKAGISVDAIGWYGTALFFPPVLQFLYAPIIDIGPRRGVWLVIVSILGALCIGGALCTPLPEHTTLYLALAFAGQAVSGLVNSCNGGLLAATLPDELRGRAGGYLNAGNLGGAALGGWLTLSMAEDYHCAPLTIALAFGALMIAPSLLALTFREPPRVVRAARIVFGEMARDVSRVARSRPGWTGILFCLSPVGTAALMNYFAALPTDFHATPRMVAFVNGPVNGLVTAAGALIGGWFCDRFDRRLMYRVAGGLTAACAIGMSLMPLSASTYAYGVTLYLFVAGLCYAAFSAVVLEAIGRAGASASTQYTLFTSAGNFAIMYVGWIDTRFHEAHGPRGMLVADGAANLVGIVLLSLFIRFVYTKLNPEPAT